MASRPSPFQAFLEDFAYPEGSDFRELDSEGTEVIPIELPDTEETQIMQNKDETREVVLYLSVNKGKVAGAELPPFELPHRWTYETLVHCIKDHMARRTDAGSIEEIVINQLYYRRSRGKTVVVLNDDRDVSSLLSEYPLMTQKDGTKRARMYLAIDYHKHAPTAATTPRRSPRIKQKNSTYDIFVHEITKDMKVSTTSNVVHNVSQSVDLKEITTLLKAFECTNVLYNPASGLYWLRKRGKQPVSLRTDQDLELCKAEYKGQSLRLACTAINLNQPIGANETPLGSRKRRLDMSSSSSANKEENDTWNQTHVHLVRDLERRGSLWRYNTKHLKLWTDDILNGHSSGINEEPDWTKHIEAITVPPKSKRLSGSPKEQPQSNTVSQTNPVPTTPSTLETLLMMMLAQGACGSTGLQIPRFQPTQPTQASASASKALTNMTTADCLSVIYSVGLAKYSNIFTEHSVDGPMLDAFVHPQFGKELMLSVGISEEDCLVLVPEIYRLKARGFNVCSSTVTGSV